MTLADLTPPLAYEMAVDLALVFGDPIAARLADKGLLSLTAPVRRVAGWDTVMPLPRMEDLYLPSVARILKAARETVNYQ